MIENFIKSPIAVFFLGVIYVAAISYLGFIPEQSDFTQIIVPYSIAFCAYLFLVKNCENVGTKALIAIAVIVRIVLLFSFPNLSDDIYRFIWDGRLICLGVNPYTVLPSEILGSYPSLDQGLFGELNSPEYYTIYPPLAQLTFYISTVFTSESLAVEAILMKSIIFFFDIVGILGCLKVLNRLNLKNSRVAIYALNPLIVVEVMGNLHYEGIMIAMLLWAIYFIISQRPVLGGLFLGLSALAKLLPLMFIPAVFFYLQKRLRWYFVVSVGITVMIGFLPFMMGAESSGSNLTDSLDLYMRKFEFNGSIYYFLRWIGFGLYGYNLIHILGPALAVVALATIVSLAALRSWQVDARGLIHILLLSFSAYLILSMTIHPWYLAVPIVLSVFSRFQFPVFWSGLIFLTYINYSYSTYSENLLIVAIEYLLVFAVIVYEVMTYGWMDDGMIADMQMLPKKRIQ